MPSRFWVPEAVSRDHQKRTDLGIVDVERRGVECLLGFVDELLEHQDDRAAKRALLGVGVSSNLVKLALDSELSLVLVVELGHVGDLAVSRPDVLGDHLPGLIDVVDLVEDVRLELPGQSRRLAVNAHTCTSFPGCENDQNRTDVRIVSTPWHYKR